MAEIKRYEKMKDSGIEWIGEIPEDWCIVPLYSLLDKRSDAIVDGPFGSDMKNEEYVDEGIPVIQLGSIKETGIDFSKMHYVSNTKADNLLRHNAFPNNIAIAKMMPAGKACELPADYNRYVVSADVIRAFVDDKNTRKLLVYALNSYATIQAAVESNGSTRARVNIGKVKRFKIIIPKDKETIKAITYYLDSRCSQIDEIIEEAKKSIEDYKALKAAVIQEAVTKGLNPDMELKETKYPFIGKVPIETKIVKLKNLVDVSDGTHDTPGYVDKTDSSFPLVTSRCIVSGHLDLSLANHISEEDYNMISTRSNVKKYDVIMPMIGTVGNPALVETDEKFAIKNVALFRTHGNKILGKFIIYILNSQTVKNQFEMRTRGGVQNFVSQDILKNLYITVPENMFQIVSYLNMHCEKINEIITDTMNIIDSLQTYKKSLIYEVVTGKRKVI